MFPGGDPSANPVEYLNMMKYFLGGQVTREDYNDLSDYLFTREISSIQTVQDASAFIEKLWVMLTPIEKMYIYNVYHGLSTAVSNMKVIESNLNELQDYTSRLEQARSDRMDIYRSGLAPDIIDAEPTTSSSTPLDDIYNYASEDVRSCLIEALQTAREDIVREESMVLSGGSDYREDTQDYRIYKLLALADAFHDFGKRHMQRFMVEIGTDIPENMKSVKDYSDPLYLVGNETNFINFLDTTSPLTFGTDEVTHTLRERNMLYQHKIMESMKKCHNKYWLAYRQQFTGRHITDSMTSVDLWCLPQYTDQKEKMLSFHVEPPKGYKHIVYLSQITGIVAAIIPPCRNNGTPLIGPKSHASKAYEISGDCPLQTFRSDIETSRTNLQSR